MKIKTVRKEICFVGLKRSGNHAVLNWMRKQFPGKGLFFNNVMPENPYEEERLKEGVIDACTEFDYIIYSLEDRSLTSVCGDDVYPVRQNEDSPAVGERINVIVLRDPFNFLASRFQWGMSSARKTLAPIGISVPQLWVMYAQEYLGQTSFLGDKKVSINYNRWCVSRKYREEIAETLGFELTDAGFDEVTEFGGGSSFDGTEFTANAGSMKTGARWQKDSDDPSFLSLFRDGLLLDLAEQIFDLDDQLSLYVKDKLRPGVSSLIELQRSFALRISAPFISKLRGSSALRTAYRKFVRVFYLRQFSNDDMPR